MPRKSIFLITRRDSLELLEAQRNLFDTLTIARARMPPWLTVELGTARAAVVGSSCLEARTRMRNVDMGDARLCV